VAFVLEPYNFFNEDLSIKISADPRNNIGAAKVEYYCSATKIMQLWYDANYLLSGNLSLILHNNFTAFQLYNIATAKNNPY
jgi:hypothetical protein